MKSTTRKLSPAEQAAAKKKYGKSKSLADSARDEKKRISSQEVPPVAKARKVEKAVKSRDPESLVSDNSLAMQIKRKNNIETRMQKALNPSRQKKSPQYGPSSQN